MNGLLFVKPAQDHRGACRHGGYASTTVSSRLERGEILVCRRGHLGWRDVSLKQRPAKHADIDHQRSQACLLNPIAQKGEFFPLGVERADQRNGPSHGFEGIMA
jgi:hypothetical protein